MVLSMSNINDKNLFIYDFLPGSFFTTQHNVQNNEQNQKVDYSPENNHALLYCPAGQYPAWLASGLIHAFYFAFDTPRLAAG